MRSRGLLKIKSSQKPSEILALARAGERENPRVILEIGSARGGTLFIWSQLASLKVLACDLQIPNYRRRLYQHFTRPDSSCEISALEGDSHDPKLRAHVLHELQGRSVDLLFIDGDHTEIGVAADYEAYAPLVRPGGLIALHDIVDQQPYPENQVQYFWKRLRVREEFEEFIDDPGQCGFGIGLVRVAQR